VTSPTCTPRGANRCAARTGGLPVLYQVASDLPAFGFVLRHEQRDNTIEEIGWTRCSEYAVQHNDTAEAERLREELKRLTGMI